MQPFGARHIYYSSFVSMDTERLVKKCQDGDREAFGILYQTYLTPMREVISYYVHEEDVIWDILHDGFLLAFSAIVSLKKPSVIKAWLTTIMKNLALQYLKYESNHQTLSTSEIEIIDDSEDEVAPSEFTWDELDNLINQLPDGYGRVFRMSAIKGMSHKEIGTLLHIAPHSSSSQLSHAKAMLRSMITARRIKIGALSILVIMLIQHVFLRHNEIQKTEILTDKTTFQSNNDVNQSVEHTTKSYITESKQIEHKETILKKRQNRQLHRDTFQETNIQDSMSNPYQLANDSTANDTTIKILNIIHNDRYVTQFNWNENQQSTHRGWSLALTYSGNSGQNHFQKYIIPKPGLPDTENPSETIEVTERTHHEMPLVIGLSFNKIWTSRWSVEAGLRYTFLKSDSHAQSELFTKETTQRIQYIGIPFKFNYRIFDYYDFSLYGHGGGAFDIPIHGRQSIFEYNNQIGKSNKYTYKIHTPWQWSVEGGIGLQYRFTPSLSIYAEPSFRYYFNTGTDIKTIRQEKPFEFTIPIGLRFSW